MTMQPALTWEKIDKNDKESIPINSPVSFESLTILIFDL